MWTPALGRWEVDEMKAKVKQCLIFILVLVCMSCASMPQESNSNIESKKTINTSSQGNNSSQRNNTQKVPLPTVLALFDSNEEFINVLSTTSTVDGITVYNCTDYVNGKNVLFQVGTFKLQNDEGKINEFGFVVLEEPFMKEVYWLPGTPMPGQFENEDDFPKDKIVSPSGIAPEAILATYKKEGLNNIWYWAGSEENGYYEIIIEPDGTVLYYDFTKSKAGESIRPNNVYKSKKEKITF